MTTPLPRDKIIIDNLLLQVVIGAHKPERSIKQNLIITITLYTDTTKCGASDNVFDTIDYTHVTRSVATYAEQAHHFTIEALAVGVARVCCLGFGVEEVTVRVEKPGAIKLARAPVVEITRRKDFFGILDTAKHPPALLEGPLDEFRLLPKNQSHYAYLALGSNLGDRLATLTGALATLRTHGKVLNTAHLYETPPAYVADQPPFLNTACLYETSLSPEELLTLVQSIEKKFGRQRTIRYGPRTLDIDILFYDHSTLVNTPTLIIPHPLIHERDFVLGPLLDIAPTVVHPTLFLTLRQLFANLRHPDALLPPGTLAHHHTPTLKRVTPIRNLLWHPEDKTYIMGVLNVTPDSFSDGGNYLDINKALAHAEKLVDQGADILDVGGQSTKPGAELISPEEEIARIVPVIKAFREKNTNIPISVDTFNAQVALEAIQAGADMINDVTGATRDPLMFSIAAKAGVPIVLMYSSATPQYAAQMTPTKPVPPITPPVTLPPATVVPPIATARLVPQEYDLIRETNNFFTRQAVKAAEAGVNRWQIIVDPGLGFAKTFEQSRELLQRGGELTTLGYSVLVGPSRKGFIGDSLGLAKDFSQSKERLLGTLACCCAAVMWGVNLVRVHDVEEVFFTVRMADAIHKPKK